MRKRFLSLGLAAVTIMSLTARDGSNMAETTKATEAIVADVKTKGSETAGTTATSDVLKIGGIGPMTDGAVVCGVAIQHSAELAMKEINEAGRINGAQIEFNFRDDEHDAEESVDVCNTLKDWDMQALIGTAAPAPCIVVAGRTVTNNMFRIIPSGFAVECAANPDVFRVYFSDPGQGAAPTKYIGENKLASKVAAIYDNFDVHSSGIYEKFVEESANQGTETVAVEAFTADSNKDFSTQLQKSKDAGVELVFPPIYYIEASLILQQASTMEFTPQLFGYDGMDGILQVENFDTKLAERLILPASFTTDTTDNLTVKLADSYKAAYDEVPIQFAAGAYDTIYATKATIEDANVAPDTDTGTICNTLEASMLNIKLNGLTGEGMTQTENGESHKVPRAVKVAGGTYTTMQSTIL